MISRTALDGLTVRVHAGEPLTDADVRVLADSRDIVRLGMLAGVVRQKLHGSSATYVRVADLKLDPASEQLLEDPDRTAIGTAGEVRLCGTPSTLNRVLDAAAAALDRAGDTPLSAFCLFELSKLPDKLPVVLHEIRKTGLGLIAQAPLDRLSAPEGMLEAVSDAGLRVARLTIDAPADIDWVAVCRQVADLQTRLTSLAVFAPLPRRIDDTQPTTGYHDVKRVALSRLLTNIDHIQVDWALYGPKLAQVALAFGADDLDSVAPTDDESRGRRRAPADEIRRSIRAAGLEPIERDARFAPRG